MILRHLKLHPFAGLVHTQFDFSPGLNVVLGPNEAGKSTMVNAILCVLFESTSYGKLHWKKNLQQFVPHGGGDTFSVTLDCDCGGAAYRITRSWGGEQRSELTLPSGQVVRKSDDVDERIAGLLKLKRGTWQNILISRQAAISSTLGEFNPAGEEASDLAQLLRKSAFDTDGVSIERLEQSIESQLGQVCSRWDQSANRPENGRGVDNPWKSGVGTMLKAWYEHQRLLNELREVENHERALDAVNQQIASLIEERNSLQQYVSKYEPIVAASKERKRLQLILEKADAGEVRLKQIQTKWPGHAGDAVRLTSSIAERAGKQEELRRELSQGHAYQKSAGVRDKLQSARAAEQKLTEAKAAFAPYVNVSSQMFRDLKVAINERDRHAASIAAGQLQVRFTPRGAMQVSIRAGLEEPREETVGENNPLHLRADGRIILKTDQFTLEVESGDGGFATIEKKYEAAQSRISNLLAAIGVTSVTQADDREAAFKLAEKTVQDAQLTLKSILSGQSLSELERECGDKLPEPKRTLEEITAAVLGNQLELEKQQRELKSIQTDIDNWQKEFKDQDALLDLLLEARQARKNCEQELHNLPPVPEKVDDLETLQRQFGQQLQRLQDIKENKLPQSKSEQAALQAREPARSTQELRDLIAVAETSVSAETRRLEALQRVQEVFLRMKQRMDSGTLDPWMHRLCATIRQVTSDRYHDLNFDGRGVTRSTGIVIPHALLSMGTKASLGFAMRLSMAAHFLEGLEGFLILDDPMVDLDRERQQCTAEILRDFAGQCQVIVLTCHEAHASLLTQSPLRLAADGMRLNP